MKMSQMSRFICVLLLSLSTLGLGAQTPSDTVVSQRNSGIVRGVQYATEVADSLLRPIPFFAGVAVSGDLAGAVMAMVTPYGSYEGALRINLKERYFPTAEVGWGVSNHTDETTDLHFKTSAPYFRVGCDYNLANDRRSGNRIFVGLRYGFSSFTYDFSGPDIIDPVWNTATPFHFTGLKGKAGWGEILFGLEAKIWSIVHVGWSARYRLRFHQSYETPGPAWYVPGFGKNGDSTFGATFNVIFDI